MNDGTIQWLEVTPDGDMDHLENEPQWRES